MQRIRLHRQLLRLSVTGVRPGTMEGSVRFGTARNAGDKNLSFETLKPVFVNAPAGLIQHSKSDPDLETVRADPRFAAMLAAAEARFAGKSGAA
jgi:hypothetical protein